MATVNRPPFWVPRPSDNYREWQGGPPVRSGTLAQLLVTQPPTKRWLPHYTLDDPGFWQGRPISAQGLIDAVSTEPPLYGAPGQVPTARWSLYYTQNDSGVWNQAPVGSCLLNTVTAQQKWYGAPGQVPTKRWSPYLTQDDPSFWRSTSIASPDCLQITATPSVPVWYKYNNDDTAVWPAASRASNIDSFPINMARAPFYALRPGDEYYWQWVGQVNNNLSAPVAPGAPSTPVFWPTSYDDTAISDVWKPYLSNDTFVLSSFLLYSPRNNWQEWFDQIDQPSTWQWVPSRNKSALTMSAVPVVPQIWPFLEVNDDVGWVNQSSPTNFNFVPIQMPRGAFYAIRPGDEQYWVGAPVGMGESLFPIFPVNVLNIYRWWDNVDQDPMWQGNPTPGYNLSVPTPVVEEVVQGRWGPDETAEERRRRHRAGQFFQWEEMPARSDFAPDPVEHPPHEPQETADEAVYVRGADPLDLAQALREYGDPLDDPEILELTEMYVKYMQAFFKK